MGFYLIGLLVKRFNTPPSQGGIRGFKSHTGHQKDYNSNYLIDIRVTFL